MWDEKMKAFHSWSSTAYTSTTHWKGTAFRGVFFFLSSETVLGTINKINLWNEALFAICIRTYEFFSFHPSHLALLFKTYTCVQVIVLLGVRSQGQPFIASPGAFFRVSSDRNKGLTHWGMHYYLWWLLKRFHHPSQTDTGSSCFLRQQIYTESYRVKRIWRNWHSCYSCDSVQWYLGLWA